MNARKKNILITGSLGQIGSSLVKILKQAGYHVLEIDREQRNQEYYFQCDLVQDDLTFLKALHLDVCIHLAGYKTELRPDKASLDMMLMNNVYSTIRLMENVSETISQFIYASSISVYGASPSPYREENPLYPKTLYGVSKAIAERYIQSHPLSEQKKSCIVRIAQLIGPDTPQHIAPMVFLNSIRDARPLHVHCTSNTTRDYVHLRDVITAILKIVNHEVVGTFNLGGGKPIAILEMAKYLSERYHAQLIVHDAPSSETDIWMVTDKIKKTLNYVPAIDWQCWFDEELENQ